MEDSAAEPVTTPIHENEESSNEKLQQKIERLTLLLKKAKESILDYTSQIRELEFELKQKDEELSSLKSKFTSISKYKPPKSESITEIITRVKVSEEVYCFINSKRGHFWIHESQLTSKHVLPEIIDSKLNKKHINDLITSSTQEWKEKCSKLTDQLCMNEENTENLRKMVQELNKQNENMEKQLRVLKENNIEKLLKTCFALYEDISEIVVQDNINNPKISSLQISFNDLNEGFNDPETIKIKENFLVILRYLMDLAKRLIYARNELKAQDSAWRSACDGLVKEKEELKNSLNKVKGESLNK
jgi:exonuclease VII large subunit